MSRNQQDSAPVPLSQPLSYKTVPPSPCPTLDIVCGRAGTGKSYFCIKEIVKCLQEDGDNTKKLIFLVPEQFTVQAERMLLAEPECGGSIIRADVVNFKRMAHRALNHTIITNNNNNSANNIIIDTPGRKMILYKAVEECAESLKLYRGALEHFGLIDELLELISETGRYKFTKDKMEAVINELPDGLTIRQKLTELSLIVEKYEDILHKKYIDDKDLLDTLIERIRDCDLYDGVKVWIDGFFGFTAQEYAIIKELLYKAEKVTITLCCDDPANRMYEQADFLHSVYKTYDSLTKIALDNNVRLKNVFLERRIKESDTKKLTRHGSNKALEHFEREYESYPVKVFENGGDDRTSNSKEIDSIGIYAAKNIYSEVEYAACKISELCRDRNLRYRDIAVAAKNIESYAPACKDIFEQNGIPFFIDAKKDLLRHPLARLIVSALDIISENFSYKTVFKYLKTGLLTYEQEIIDRIENHVLAKNISSFKRWMDDERWVFQDEDLGKAINSERGLILEPLVKLKESLGRNKDIRGKAEALYDFLIDIEIPEIIANRDEEYVKIWNGLLNVLDKMAEALGHENVSTMRFSNIFKAGLENYQIGEIPTTLDCVQIGNLDRTKNGRIKALFFMEANEGVVPGGAPKEGLITDSERLLLKEHNISLAADSHEQAYLEEFQIYDALMSPADYLFLSYVIKDSEGKAKRPSRIISRVLKMFPGIKALDDILEEEIYIRPKESLSSAEYAFSKYLYYLGNGMRENVWEEAGRYFSRNEEYKARIQGARKYRDSLKYELNISGENAQGLFGSDIITSVSRIEKYYSCPYAFFMEYGIKAKERDIPSFNSKETGTFVHEILEKIGGNLEESDIDAIVKNVLEENNLLSLKDSKRSAFLAKRMGDMVKRVADIISRQIKSGKFKPYEFEAECNMKVKLKDGRYARLTGKIDRIDSYCDGDNTYYRVIDYKTGNKEFNNEDLYNGTSLQLTAYLDSIVKNNKNALPAGVFYFNIRDRFIKLDSELTEDEIEAKRRKNYKFNGLVLADPDIVRAMDENIKSSSEIIPAGINKDGTLSKRSRAATKEQFQELFTYTEEAIAKAIDGYTGGDTAVKPVKNSKGLSACEYCAYHSVCGYERGAGKP